MMFYTGATLVLRRKFSAKQFIPDIRENKCTVFQVRRNMCYSTRRAKFGRPPARHASCSPRRASKGGVVRGPVWRTVHWRALSLPARGGADALGWQAQHPRRDWQRPAPGHLGKGALRRCWGTRARGSLRQAQAGSGSRGRRSVRLTSWTSGGAARPWRTHSSKRASTSRSSASFTPRRRATHRSSTRLTSLAWAGVPLAAWAT